MTNQIDCFTVNFVHAIEYKPRGLPVVLENRIEEITSISFEIWRSTFSYFDGKILLNIPDNCSEYAIAVSL